MDSGRRRAVRRIRDRDHRSVGLVGLFAGVFDVKVSGEQESRACPRRTTSGTIDLEKVLKGFADVVGKEADAATKEQLKAAVTQFESLGYRREDPFEIWIDAEGLPRRQRITMDFGKLVPGAEDASMEMTVDFSDFGKPVSRRASRNPRSRPSSACSLPLARGSSFPKSIVIRWRRGSPSSSIQIFERDLLVDPQRLELLHGRSSCSLVAASASSPTTSGNPLSTFFRSIVPT